MSAREASRKRLLMVGQTRYPIPLDLSLARKFDALSKRLELLTLGVAVRGHEGDDARFRLYRPSRPAFIDGLTFHLALPFRVASALRRFRPDVVLVQGAHEAVSALLARTLARTHTKIVFDVQGDWRAVTRLYGSPLRRLFSPLADALAGIAVRRVDGFRTIGPYTSSLVRAYGREPLDEFPTYMDLEPFLAPARSLPKPPQALFVGVLEPYKAIDVLVEAWRKIAPDFPQARLQLVGSGSRKTLVQTLLRDLPNQVVWTPALSTPEVAQALERSSFLVLPSRSEGMGRVVIESLCRGRPVLGSRVGGIRDLVRDGENGLLVEPGDADELAEAFRKLLGDPSLLTSLAVAARASAEPWLLSPAEFAERMNNVVELSLQ